MADLRIGIPILGGPHWMAGVTYVEMLARSVQSLDAGERPQLHLVATPASLPHVEAHFHLLPLFRGVIVLLEPGMDPAPFRAGNIQVCRDRRELFGRIDFLYPVLNDAWPESSASWIPDFQHRFLPDFFPPAERADRDAAFGKVAAEARLLVLSSAAVEADFRKLYPGSRAVTRVLSFFAFADETVFRADPGEAARKYALPGRYLLCCNQFWMHKDHRTLFRALAGLRKKGLSIPLVCTGTTSDYRSAGYFDALKAEMAGLGLGDQVRILGMVPREDQLQIIRRSCALVQPSLFEGWSSIVEDARSLGKPIFLSDLPVHKEQDPPGGTFFAAGDPEALAAALEAGFPGLPPGPVPEAEGLARARAGERMRAFGRSFLALAREAVSLSAEPTASPGTAGSGTSATRSAGRGDRAIRTAGVNLIGYASSNLGLGTAARNTLAMLEDRDIPVSVYDLDAGGGRSLHETYFRARCVARPDQLPHGINLWHMNPPEVVHLLDRSVPKFAWDRFNVCVPFWELGEIPEAWIAPLEAMDLVLAPTRFIEGNLAARLPSARVRHFRQPLRTPEPARLGRETWGIPPGDVVFVTSFDCGSDLQRKNPSGAVAAFLARFRGRPDVRLIVKWVNEDLDADSRRSAAALRAEVAGHANIRILDRTMPYAEVLALYRAADAYVSLHRAEGLGLGLMECMALGKPVIGTAWSGNMDFMTESNSCLVGHRLVPVPSGSLYDRMLGGKPARWAEPDLGEAADWMLRLADDPGLRSRIGARAEEDIREYNRVARRGEAFEDLGALWEAHAAHPAAKPAPGVPGADPAPAHGVNLIGFVSANIGLGAAARQTLDRLVERGWRVSVYDVDAGLGRSRHETYFRERCVPSPDRLPHGINLWHMNPPEIADAMARTAGAIEWDRYNVCVPFWELPALPDDWMKPLAAMDLVLAPTRFIEAALASRLPREKIRYYRQALRLPEIPPLGRKDFGIPENDLVFVTSFDFGSDILRKNPVGSLVAFLRNFRGRPGVRMILKWVNQDLDDLSRAASAKLRVEVAAHRNIQIVDRTLPYPEVLALYRAADVYVSLHRAEGLGLGLMESMALGKPVIGTAWSGNMDFMTEQNSCLVKYRLVEVPRGGTYDERLGGKDAQWAEPDLEDAAAWMARLAEDPALRRRLGERAAEDIRAHNRAALGDDPFAEIASLHQRDLAAAPGRPPKAFGSPPPKSFGSHPPEAAPAASRLPERPSASGKPEPGPVAAPRAPAQAATRVPGPLDTYGQPGPWPARPADGPDGEYPLHLRRLASVGLLTPLPGSSRGTSKVTAVVSTYSSERFIRGCLQNLVEQTLFAEGRLEIVVVDSGSPQGEGAVVSEYRSRHPGIVYLRTERETLYAAWNRAVKASTGTYLVNANTDDRHRPDAFAKLADALDASYAGLAYGDALLTGGENETWESNTATHVWHLPDFNVRQALLDCPFGCVVMWRRSLHDELGYFDPAFKITGDYEFFLKSAILRGAIHVKEPLALYYESMKNLSYGNQDLVNREVDTFLRPARLNTPMETIYPSLRVDRTHLARLAAAMDFAALLVHPLARPGPVEALARLVAVSKEVGLSPELANNMASILLMLGHRQEAEGMMRKLMAGNPGLAASLGLGSPAGDWVPTRMIRIEYDGLRAIADPVFSAQTRIPLPGRGQGEWSLGSRAAP